MRSTYLINVTEFDKTRLTCKLIILVGAYKLNIIINCKETVVTLILSWREPFNNFDPIVNYTVSCSGDDKCPSIYTTTDNNTRINNLRTRKLIILVGAYKLNTIINCKETVVTLILSWREPFNNFDPIVNYTVSCSGDDKCPSIYTTTDNNTRTNNLTPMTNYTFSVVATNSIGSGEAGVVMITTPPGVHILILHSYEHMYKY